MSNDVARMSKNELEREVIRLRKYADNMRSKERTIDQQWQDIEALEVKNFRLKLENQLLLGGIPAVMDMAVNTYEELRQTLAEHRYAIERSFQLPEPQEYDERKELQQLTDIMEDGKSVIVWGRVWIWHKQQKVDLLTITPAIYPGAIEKAYKELSNAMIAACYRYPIPDDITLRGSYDGVISLDEWLQITRDLTPYYDLHPDEYDSMLNAAFMAQWEANSTLRKKHDHTKYNHTASRKAAKKQFAGVIETIFKNRNSRIRLKNGGNNSSPHEPA